MSGFAPCACAISPVFMKFLKGADDPDPVRAATNDLPHLSQSGTEG